MPAPYLILHPFYNIICPPIATPLQFRYQGKYDDEGKKTGHGKYTYPDHSVYEGEFKDDVKSGKGTYRASNGDVYEGGK